MCFYWRNSKFYLPILKLLTLNSAEEIMRSFLLKEILFQMYIFPTTTLAFQTLFTRHIIVSTVIAYLLPVTFWKTWFFIFLKENWFYLYTLFNYQIVYIYIYIFPEGFLHVNKINPNYWGDFVVSNKEGE